MATGAKAKKRLFLIDGHSYTYQTYYAIRNLNAPDGMPVNAVYGFTNLLLRILTVDKPDYLVVTFDAAGKTFRHDQFADYKAGRKPMPDDLVAQMPLIREVIQALQIPIVECTGYEADDLLGALVRRASSQDVYSYLITKDKDLKQLLDERTVLFDVVKNEEYNVESLQAELGITPAQMIDYLGLAGDNVDNIPGIPGVGPKTAINLIQQFGSMEGVLAAADQITKPKLRSNLTEFADQARLSKQLATIATDAPLSVDVKDLSIPPIDAEKVLPLFVRLGFRKFAAQVQETDSSSDASTASAEAADANYTLINDEKALAALIKTLSKQKILSVDLETTSVSEMRAQIVGLAFCFKSGEGYYVAVRGPLGGKTLDPTRTLAALKPVLENADILKVGQNIKYDALVLLNHEIHLSSLYFDTMIASYLLQPERRGHKLEELALAEFNYRMIPISELIGKGKKQITMDQVPLEEVSRYACEDADIAFRLYEVYKERIEQEELAKLFYELEMPLVQVLIHMEFSGIRLDTQLLAQMQEQLADRICEIEKEIYQSVGEPFNIASPKQLAEILFEKLGLRQIRKTKTGYSTDAKVLQELAWEHPLPGKIIEYRQLTKLKSTYVDTLPELINPKTGKIHASFNQAVAATGRLSSSDPNLQNIPVRTELGRQIRAAFTVSDPSKTLITADYSQIELRILAHLSQDAALLQAFRDGRDIHTEVGCQVFGVKPEDLKKEDRILAKAVNFGIIYGQSPYGLSQELKIPQAEAKDFIEKYFATYPGVQQFIEEVIQSARSQGYVKTMLGRRRGMPDIDARQRQAREYAERTAVNTVIQGSAADLIKVAMNNILKHIHTSGSRARILLQIHDELVFEVPTEDVGMESKTFEERMTGAMDLRVPLTVNIAVGDNWLEVE